LESLKESVLREIKRRIQVLKLSNAERLLSKLGIKSAQKGKFETEEEQEGKSDKVDYMLKLQEIFEISDDYTMVLDFFKNETREAAKNLS
jgi:hypothetical protein